MNLEIQKSKSIPYDTPNGIVGCPEGIPYDTPNGIVGCPEGVKIYHIELQLSKTMW